MVVSCGHFQHFLAVVASIKQLVKIGGRVGAPVKQVWVRWVALLPRTLTQSSTPAPPFFSPLLPYIPVFYISL